jgi:cation diffusion facilitator family transporter
MARKHSPSVVAIWIGLVSNIMLTVLKIIVGSLFQSPVLVADGIHNAGDVVATLAALASSQVSRKPADADHPYGHGKAEVVAAGLVAVVLALAALWIGYQSIVSFFAPPHDASWLSLAAAAVSLVLKQALYVYTMRVGKAQRSKSAQATAYDHLADVYASLAAVVGIGLALWGDRAGVAWASYADPAAGLIVTLLVIRLAYKLGREATDILMEKTVPPHVIEQYGRVISELDDIRRIDRIRAREHGQYIIVDVRVGIPSHYTIQRGHDISRQIKKRIMDHDPHVGEVLVHLNPWEDDGDKG